MDMSKVSFPGFIEKIFVINANIEDVLKDQNAVKLLSSRQYKEKVFVLETDFEEHLFKEMQKFTVNEIYGGGLSENTIFDLNNLVWDVANKDLAC